MIKKSIKLDNNSFITFNPINARTVHLLSGKTKPEIKTKGHKIIEVNYRDFIIKVGEQVNLKEPFKINSIEKIEDGFFLHACELSKTSYFLLPILDNDRAYFMWNSLFTNAYIDIENTDYKLCGPHIYLVYRFNKRKVYQDFEYKIESHSLYLKTFDVDPYQVIYVFKIPKKHFKNFEVFRQGKYSELDSRYKENIIDFHNTSFDSELSQILCKSTKRREKMEKDFLVKIKSNAELFDFPHMNTETFYNNYLIKNHMIPNIKFGLKQEI